jgi:hypothetical protein
MEIQNNTRKYPKEVQIFLLDDGEIVSHPVFDDWESLIDYYIDLPVEEKLAFDDTLDRIVKQNRKKLEKLEKDELGRKVLLVEDVEKYFK